MPPAVWPELAPPLTLSTTPSFLSSGKSGVGVLDSPLVQTLPAKFAAEARFTGDIEEFGPLDKEQKKAIRKGLKLMCRESQMGVAAAQLALGDAKLAVGSVDPERIGCIGHSLGGHNTMFTAAFDTRIQALVSNCGFTSFPKYYKGDLKGWTSDRYMPLIATKYDSKPEKMPFDFSEVVAALKSSGSVSM